MTLQWTLAAAFLYTEMAVLFLFCLPFISPSRWNRIFKSRVVSATFEYGNFYFNVFVIIMTLLLADSGREIMKYGKVDGAAIDPRNNPQAEQVMHMKLFRAQRNLYISGFSLFLLIVLRRVVRLLSRQAVLEASNEASLKQAKSASDQCQKLMDENDKLTKALDKVCEYPEDSYKDEEKDEDKGKDEVDQLKHELEQKSKELTEKSEDLEKTKKDLTALREQAAGVSREYDRLLEEHTQVQAQIDKGDKKDD